MADDEYGYQEDFYDTNTASFPNSPVPSNNRQHRNNNQEEDDDFTNEHRRYKNNNDAEDDEQLKQQMSGKIDHLQQRIEELENELESERKHSLEMNKKYEEEVKLAWSSQVKAEEKVQALEKQASVGESSSSKDETKELKKELAKLRKENEGLQDRVELLMITNSGKAQSNEGTNGGDKRSGAVPLTLEEEFHRYCKRTDVFLELTDRTLSIDDCVKILRYASNTRSRSGKVRSETSNHDGENNGGGQSTVEAKNRLHERIRALERELRAASVAAEDGDGLKNRIFQLSERIRVEKEHKRAVDAELVAAKKKIDMLSDHIEKLVTHLKREGAHKVRLAEQLRLTEKEGQRIREKADIIHRKSSAKDRLILELREGSKVLEDQLRLMDEKYLELRGKLDYTRTVTGKKIKKAEKEAADLRVKFAMTGSSVALDSIKLPMNSQSQPGTASYDYGGLDNESWHSEYFPPGRSDSPPSGKRKGSDGGLRGSKSTVGMQISFDASAISHQTKASKPPSLDGVLEKIRLQQGAKQEWTEEKIKKLTKAR
jgi:uncharacterized coiled-coil DUF342 family protein